MDSELFSWEMKDLAFYVHSFIKLPTGFLSMHVIVNLFKLSSRIFTSRILGKSCKNNKLSLFDQSYEK